jgi:hypothetical protein
MMKTKKILLLLILLPALAIFFPKSAKAASIKLLTFNGGEEYLIGQTYELKWEQSDIQSVLPILIKNGNNSWNTGVLTPITVDPQASTGSYMFTIPNIAPGDYTLTILGYPGGGVASIPATSAATFAVKRNASITVTNPTSGEVIRPGSIVTIKWTQTGYDLDYGIFLNKGSQISSRLVESTKSLGSHSYDWHVPETIAPGDDYRIQIGWSESVGLGQKTYAVTSFSGYFSVATNYSPKINFTVPSTVTLGKETNFSWTSQCTGGKYALWLVTGENNQQYEEKYRIQQLNNYINTNTSKPDQINDLLNSSLSYPVTTNNGTLKVVFPTNTNYSYGRILSNIIPLRYSVSENGDTIYAREVSSQEVTAYNKPLPEGQYRLFLSITDGTYNGSTCHTSGFSQTFSVVNSSVGTTPPSYQPVAPVTPPASQPPIVPANNLDQSLTNKLRGRILLQVESHGEAWYVNPTTGKRQYLADGTAAYSLMREQGLGITDADLAKIPIGLESRFQCKDTDNDGLCDTLEDSLGTDKFNPDTDGDSYTDGQEVKSNYNPLGPGALSLNADLSNKLKGKILLQVQQHGEAWYINPVDGKRYYMPDGSSAYQIMRYLSLGISNTDLSKIADK